MENLKIEKGKTYTYEELKEIYNNAMMHTIDNPTESHKDNAKYQLSLMLSGIIILNTLENNLFEKEENDERREF